VDRARPGEILALHDGDEPGRSTGRCLAADALPEILRGLKARGMEPAPVAALLAERPYRESPRRAWSGRTRGGRLGNAIFVHTVRRLGLGPAGALASLVAAWFTVAGGAGRRASVDLRRRLLGPGNPVAEWLWVYRHFRTYGRTLLWRIHFVEKGGAPPEVTAHGYESIRGVVEAPGPLLLVSAHLGDWTGVSRRLQVQEKRPLWVVAFRGIGVGPHQVRAAGGESKYRLIDVESSPGDVALAMATALGAGDAVAIHADRLMDDGDGVRVPFLGSEALFPRGVWNVAMVTGAPAIVYFAVPTAPDRVEMRCYGPIRVPRVPPARREEAVTAAAREFAGYLEDCVRRHPFHWGNFHDFWKA
jgi:predicted LPLAT superfamily acyltransferase